MKTNENSRDTTSKARSAQGEPFGGCTSTSLPWRSSMRDLLYAAACSKRIGSQAAYRPIVTCVPAYLSLPSVRGGIRPPRRRWPGTVGALAHLASAKNCVRNQQICIAAPLELGGAPPLTALDSDPHADPSGLTLGAAGDLYARIYASRRSDMRRDVCGGRRCVHRQPGAELPVQGLGRHIAGIVDPPRTARQLAQPLPIRARRRPR